MGYMSWGIWLYMMNKFIEIEMTSPLLGVGGSFHTWARFICKEYNDALFKHFGMKLFEAV